MKYIVIRRISRDVEIVLSDAVPPRAKRLSMPLAWADAVRIGKSLGAVL